SAPVIYQVVARSLDSLVFVTHQKARRGRGTLFATAPPVVYVLTCCALFALSVGDLSLWDKVKETAAWGAGVAAVLSALAFVLGRKIHDTIEADREKLRILRVPALGPVREETLRYAELAGFGIDPSLRSLGADNLLVAVGRD